MKKLAASLSLFLSLAAAGCGDITRFIQDSSQRSNGFPLSANMYFTQADEHPEQAVELVIRNARTTLDIAIYSITEEGIIKEILNAKKRGVQVRLITDEQQVQNKYQNAEIRKLIAAGIPVKVNSHSGLMHLKMTVADNRVTVLGSFNYTRAASTTNDEVLVVLDDPQIAEKCRNEFERMWNDRKRFREFH